MRKTFVFVGGCSVRVKVWPQLCGPLNPKRNSAANPQKKPPPRSSPSRLAFSAPTHHQTSSSGSRVDGAGASWREVDATGSDGVAAWMKIACKGRAEPERRRGAREELGSDAMRQE
eukprot:2880445-Rhodomonas_salina.1